jgi:hypothetical protein
MGRLPTLRQLLLIAAYTGDEQRSITSMFAHNSLHSLIALELFLFVLGVLKTVLIANEVVVCRIRCIALISRILIVRSSSVLALLAVNLRAAEIVGVQAVQHLDLAVVFETEVDAVLGAEPDILRRYPAVYIEVVEFGLDK